MKRKRPLSETHPELAKHWHPSRNAGISLETVSVHYKKPIWWICDEGHEYAVSPSTRQRVGCRICNKEAAKKDHSLIKARASKRGSISEREPELLKRWDYVKNNALGVKPDGITPASSTKIHWKCENGHEYERSPKQERTSGNCPVCYEKDRGKYLSQARLNKRKNEGATFSDLFPTLLSEWDFAKNKRQPEDYAPQSNISVWWKCVFGHSWKAPIYNRSGLQSGCPSCRLNASRMEIFTYAETKYFFPDCLLKSQIDGKEADIFIPSKSIAIEVDGSYWHREKVEADKEKDITFRKAGVTCFRLRDTTLPVISDRCVSWTKDSLLENMKRLFSAIGNEIDDLRLKDYQNRSEPVNPELYNEVVSRLPAPEYENSLVALYPELSKEWDGEANGYLNPSMFSPGSMQKVHWLCASCSHQWEASIKNRAKLGSRCPKCAIASSRRKDEPCPVCGKMFHPKGSQKTCSTKCSGEFKQKLRIKNRCDYCGNNFVYKESERKRRFCSQDCWRASTRVAHEVACEHCGNLFINKSSKVRRFCSQKCNYAHRSVFK